MSTELHVQIKQVWTVMGTAAALSGSSSRCHSKSALLQPPWMSRIRSPHLRQANLRGCDGLIWLGCHSGPGQAFAPQIVHFAFISYVLRRSRKELFSPTPNVLREWGKNLFHTSHVLRESGKPKVRTPKALRRKNNTAANTWDLQLCSQSDERSINPIHAKWTIWRKTRYVR